MPLIRRLAAEAGGGTIESQKWDGRCSETSRSKASPFCYFTMMPSARRTMRVP